MNYRKCGNEVVAYVKERKCHQDSLCFILTLLLLLLLLPSDLKKIKYFEILLGRRTFHLLQGHR
jgi:hypothetical protein